MSVYTTNDGELCCPLCGGNYTHLREVRVGARPQGEDGPDVSVGITHAGRLVTEAVPASPTMGAGRRHRFALVGYCELCSGQFALVFTQHKGVTFVESVKLGSIDMFEQREPLDVESRSEVQP